MTTIDVLSPTALLLVDAYWTSMAEKLTGRGFASRWERESTHPFGRIVTDDPSFPDISIRLDDPEHWNVVPVFERNLPPDIVPWPSLSSLGLPSPQQRRYRRTQSVAVIARHFIEMLTDGRTRLESARHVVLSMQIYRQWRARVVTSLGLTRVRFANGGGEDHAMHGLHHSAVVGLVERDDIAIDVTLTSSQRVRLDVIGLTDDRAKRMLDALL